DGDVDAQILKHFGNVNAFARGVQTGGTHQVHFAALDVRAVADKVIGRVQGDGGDASAHAAPSPRPVAMASPIAFSACSASSPCAVKRRRWPCFTPSATTFIRLRPFAGLPLPSRLVTVISLLNCL